MDFKEVPGYNGRYLVNKNGDVMSAEADCIVRNIKRRDGLINSSEIWHRKAKLLRPIRTKTCKPLVHLYDPEGRRKNFYVAQLVLMCFVTEGELIHIKRIEYIDGDMYNYRLDNLRIKSL